RSGHLHRVPREHPRRPRATRPVEGERRVRVEGAFRHGRNGGTSGVLVLLARAPPGRARPHPGRAHRNAGVHRLVEFPGGTYREQHPGVRIMTVPRSFPVFAVVFAATFAVAHFVCVNGNYALFTYHPAIYEWGMGAQKPKDGPAMYWF